MNLLPKSGILPVTHHVPDVLEQGLAVVFCGTALGRQSALAHAYYANPGNFFWRALHETGMTPTRVVPKEYESVRALGIGLTDLCKTAFGNDAELPGDAFDRAALEQKIHTYQPHILAFTSKTGAAEYLGQRTGGIAYGFQEQMTGRTRMYVLPSPSGHARRYWEQGVWQTLADEYQKLKKMQDSACDKFL